MFKQKKLSILRASILFILAGAVTSQAFADYDTPLYSLQPAYVGIALGFGGMRINDGSGIFSSPQYQRDYTVNDSDESSGSYVYQISGGYLFPMNDKFEFGPEISYTSYNDKTFTLTGTSGSSPVSETDTYSGYTLEVLANATYFFNRTTYSFTKLGFAYVTQNLVYDLTSRDAQFNGSTSNTQHKIMPDIHLGLGFQMAKNFGLEFSGFGLLGGADTDPTKYKTASSQSNQVASVWGLLIGFHLSF
jgi:hypothetical protein